VLVEHTWAVVLAEAISRLGGTQTAGEFVDGTQVAEVWDPVASRNH
ncbi:MAG: hypothetical protein JO372_21830, partial [Solirubrobacterales bacterium]|nr:hypothetical protein [Solirubrobacterales bacterium]